MYTRLATNVIKRPPSSVIDLDLLAIDEDDQDELIPTKKRKNNPAPKEPIIIESQSSQDILLEQLMCNEKFMTSATALHQQCTPKKRPTTPKTTLANPGSYEMPAQL